MPGELILVVEDFDPLREGMCEVLLEAGFNVIAAHDGQEALDQMNSLLPELILSDITMPRMDGYEFFKAVRARPEWVSIPFIFLSARSASQDLLAGRDLGVEDYLTKPIHWDELVTTVRSRLNRFHQSQVMRVQQAYLDSLITLANAIEQRAPGGDEHIQHVTALVTQMARRLGWADRRLETLRFAAVLHDIGKIHISAVILFKPGPLDETEWEAVRRHPVVGAEMIKDVPYLARCAPFVRHHHERWDGLGYPDGLAGLDIPDGARLLAVADSFDAMCSPRPYARQHSPQEALEALQQDVGTRYDQEAVRVLQSLWAEGMIQTICQPASERLAP